MFACVAEDEKPRWSRGCICHSPGFARLSACLSQDFARSSSVLRAGAPMGVFAAGLGSASAPSVADATPPIAFINVRVFDGKSDALLSGVRVSVRRCDRGD